MKPTAIYARFSSDLQRDKSIADQFALCREYLTRHSLELVAEYSDAAKTGASIIGRNGLLTLPGSSFPSIADNMKSGSQARSGTPKSAATLIRFSARSCAPMRRRRRRTRPPVKGTALVGMTMRPSLIDAMTLT